MLCCSSADGNYEVTLMTKATVYCTGLVLWQPPAVYKSSCSIDVEFFPYDVQTCVLKLGSWTYDGFKVTMIMYRLAGKKKKKNLPGSSMIFNGTIVYYNNIINIINIMPFVAVLQYHTIIS